MILIKVIINLLKIVAYFFGFEFLHSPLKSQAEIFSVKLENLSNFSCEENCNSSNPQSKSNYVGILLFTAVIVTFMFYTSGLSDVFSNIPEKGVEEYLPPVDSNSVILKYLNHYKNYFNQETLNNEEARRKLRDEFFDWFSEANVDDLMDRGKPRPGGLPKPTPPIWNDGLIHDDF